MRLALGELCISTSKRRKSNCLSVSHCFAKMVETAFGSEEIAPPLGVFLGSA